MTLQMCDSYRRSTKEVRERGRVAALLSQGGIIPG